MQTITIFVSAGLVGGVWDDGCCLWFDGEEGCLLRLEKAYV